MSSAFYDKDYAAGLRHVVIAGAELQARQTQENLAMRSGRHYYASYPDNAMKIQPVLHVETEKEMPPKRKQQYRHLPAFILLALAEGPIHGGAIHSVLTKTMSQFKADTGAVYRALQQLELEGEVESSWDTSLPGPARRIYKLTPAGWEKLDRWKEDIELRMENLTFFLTTYKRIRDMPDK